MNSLLKLTTFDEEELLALKKTIDKDIFLQLEIACKLYENAISIDKDIFLQLEIACKLYENNGFPDLNWDLMNKVLDLGFFLSLDKKFIIWYEELISRYAGIYIHLKDDTEYYHSTILIKELEELNTTKVYYHDNEQKEKYTDINGSKSLRCGQENYQDHYGFKLEKEHKFNKFYSLIVNDTIDVNFKYIHLYMSRLISRVSFTEIPVIITTKIPSYKIETKSIHNSKRFASKYLEKPHAIINFRESIDLIIDTKIYINNKCTINPTIFTHFSLFENVSGYLPLAPACFDEMWVSMVNCEYLEITYCNLDRDMRDTLCDNSAVFLNGKAMRAKCGWYMEEYKPLHEREKPWLEGVCGCKNLDNKTPKEIHELSAKQHLTLTEPNKTIVDEIFTDFLNIRKLSTHKF